MTAHDEAIKKIDPLPSIIGKKRSYKEAMGYDNDYEVVQDPNPERSNQRNSEWTDAYSEQLAANIQKK